MNAEHDNPNCSGETVLVTVGVIVRNEQEHITATLEHLAQMQFSQGKFEVIVVDGNSTDGTPALIHQFAGTHPELTIRLITESKPGSHGNARNTVLDHARGRYIAFTDADCLVAEDWLEKLVGVLEKARQTDTSVVGAGGIRYPVETTDWKERILNAMFASPLGNGGSAGFALKGHRYVDSIPNYNAIYLAEVAREVRYLPIRVGEDFEFNHQLGRAGYRLVQSSTPVVRHRQEGSFVAFARQMWGYGRGQAAVWKLSGFVRPFAPVAALFWLGVLLGGFLLLPFPALIWVYVAVVGVYAAVIVVGTLALVIGQRSWRLVPALVLFPLQHACYGLGFVYGLLIRTPALSRHH
jgi:glycosyltransferase involved in cell wall biosynthesis